MRSLLDLPLAAAVILVAAAAPALAEDHPPLMPTRDVDIIYKITRPHQPAINERARWLASEDLERIDGPDKSTTIFDARKEEITLLNSANRTYRKLEGTPRRPAGPEKGVVLTRGGESVIAGLRCTDWSWAQDVETHTACLTPDGVLLRLIVDGKTVMQAQSVSYGPQKPEFFEVPPNYQPALAPEGISSQ
jgi:hypothetical protein